MKNRVLLVATRSVVVMGIGYLVDGFLIQMYSRDRRVIKLASNRRK